MRRREATNRSVVLLISLLLAACASVRNAPPSATAQAAVASGSAGDAVPVAAASSATPRASGKPSVRIGLATGSERETDYRMGRDLAEFVGPDAGLSLDVRATKGSVENLHLLEDDPDVDLAIVQYDVVQAVNDLAAKGNAAAAKLVKPLRIVMPLYTQEIYLIVRRDSPMNSVHEIRGHSINVGLAGGGSALTIAALYERMFRMPIPPGKARYLSDDRALSALTLDKSVDVVAVVAGQPAKILADMKPQAREYIKLLKLDAADPSTQAAYRVYFPATIRASNYAAWLDTDVPALSVMSFLVTSDKHREAFAPLLVQFARSMCRQIETLKTQGHPKWQEVDPGQRLGFRWRYAAASEAEFDRCKDRRALSAAKP